MIVPLGPGGSPGWLPNQRLTPLARSTQLQISIAMNVSARGAKSSLIRALWRMSLDEPPAYFTRRASRVPSALPYLALGSTPAEFVREGVAIRREFERDRIDAVSLAGWRRAIGKDMPLVCTTTSANDLRADHAVAGVANGLEVVS